MDTILPSYESAVDRDAWTIIAHYIASSDLCAASRVCRRWHAIFVPLLWGHPTAHFGAENDVVYGMFTKIPDPHANNILTLSHSGTRTFSPMFKICQSGGQIPHSHAAFASGTFGYL